MPELTTPAFHIIQPGKKIKGDWCNLPVPENIIVGNNSVIDSTSSFKQFFSKLDPAMIIGSHVTLKGTNLATEKNAYISIGDYCYIINATIVASEKIIIGNYVFIAGGVNIVDTDFHPIDPAKRLADTVVLSPAGKKDFRPEFNSKAVIIEDEVWIGYNATILKGITIGKKSVIQPGSVVTHDVPPDSIVIGNPARVINQKR